MSDIFNVIADPTRRALLLALASKAQSVGELVALTGEVQPTVSKHLKALRDAGLVSVTADGQVRIYALDRGPLGEVASFLEELAPGIAGTGAGSAEATDVVEKGLTDAAVALAGWINTGATWLGEKVSEKVADANLDTAELGRQLGRKLADAKLAAGDIAAEAQEQLGSDFAELTGALGQRAGEVKANANELVAEILKSLKREATDGALASASDTASDAKAKVVAVADLDEEEF